MDISPIAVPVGELPADFRDVVSQLCRDDAGDLHGVKGLGCSIENGQWILLFEDSPHGEEWIRGNLDDCSTLVGEWREPGKYFLGFVKVGDEQRIRDPHLRAQVSEIAEQNRLRCWIVTGTSMRCCQLRYSRDEGDACVKFWNDQWTAEERNPQLRLVGPIDPQKRFNPSSIADGQEP